MDLPVAMLPADTLKGQVALVTGGGAGLGRAIAEELARAGADVAIASRSAGNRAKGVAAVEALGRRAADVPLDVRNLEQVAAAFDAAEAALGPVTILVNNAAANFYAPAEKITPNGWDTIVDRVLKGGFYMCSEFGRRRLAAGGGGSIVNISAGQGVSGGPGIAHSGAAKAGMLNLTISLATEWAPDRIRVNAVIPGLFPHGDDPPVLAAGRHWGDGSHVPIGRVGEVREIGWLVAFLCSPYAGFITGQQIAIDGGGRLPHTIFRGPVKPVRDQIG